MEVERFYRVVDCEFTSDMSYLPFKSVRKFVQHLLSETIIHQMHYKRHVASNVITDYRLDFRARFDEIIPAKTCFGLRMIEQAKDLFGCQGDCVVRNFNVQLLSVSAVQSRSLQKAFLASYLINS